MRWRTSCRPRSDISIGSRCVSGGDVFTETTISLPGRNDAPANDAISPAGAGIGHVVPDASPKGYWDARAHQFARQGAGLAAVCSYGMPSFYNSYIDLLQRRALDRWLIPTREGTVLEIGCGVGRWTRRLARTGTDVVGLDLSETMIAEARRRARRDGVHERCRFLVADSAEFALRARFDRIVGIPDRHPGGPMGTSDRLAQSVRARPRGRRRGTRSMRIPWPHNLRERAAWGAVALAGGLAIGASWLEQWRPLPPDRLASITIRVTSEADEGPGSLREAILAADRATRRTRIVVDVPTITLAATLPPLVNPHGVVLEAREGRVELNGTHIAGPILDIAAAGTIVSGFRIVGGGAGLVVRAPG